MYKTQCKYVGGGEEATDGERKRAREELTFLSKQYLQIFSQSMLTLGLRLKLDWWVYIITENVLDCDKSYYKFMFYLSMVT